ncbi:helix-turn-helix transcriptional regulator, partial [Burkholderia cenocepacia]|nr:helix-turn-helix transcriptional regulator [Burkholderia cenocepacia]
SPSAIVFYRLDQSGEPADFELFGMPESMHRTYVARYRMLDPLHPPRSATGDRAVVTLASQLPDERRDASAYWTRFLRRHDVADVVEIWLRDAGRTVGAFSL